MERVTLLRPARAGYKIFDPNSKYWDAGAHWSDQIREIPGSYFEYANLNFGLLAEIIERVTGQRFDQFMQNEVIAPLGMTGSFNPCTLPRDQLAAGFRKRNANDEWDSEGSWYAQVDGERVSCFYGMAALKAPDQFLTYYSLGNNATLFSPQGGYRGNVMDLMALLQLLVNEGKVNGASYLTRESVSNMLKPSWSLNERGDNGRSAGEAEPGSPFDGLMTSYGLSVHRISPQDWGFSNAPELLLGHLGEAYGVLSHALLDPQTGDGIATIITGTADDPTAYPGHSPLYRVEESVIQWWLENRQSITQDEVLIGNLRYSELIADCRMDVMSGCCCRSDREWQASDCTRGLRSRHASLSRLARNKAQFVGAGFTYWSRWFVLCLF